MESRGAVLRGAGRVHQTSTIRQRSEVSSAGVLCSLLGYSNSLVKIQRSNIDKKYLMKNEPFSRLGLPNPRILFGVLLCCSACFCVVALAQNAPKNSHIEVGHSYHNDVSPALRDLAVAWPPKPSKAEEFREANLNRCSQMVARCFGPKYLCQSRN